MNKWWMWLIVLTLGIGVVAALSLKNNISAAPLASAQLLPVPKILPDFKLEKNKGNLFPVKSFNNHWSLIFFGFTSCPDYCPLTLQKLGNLLTLAQKNIQQTHSPLQVIFISLDPERDTPEKINTYTNFFHPQIQGVSGSNPELAQIAHFFGSDYSRTAISAGTSLTIPAGIDMPANIGNDYQLDHSARVYIVNPQMEYIGSFAPPHNTEQMWADLQIIMGK